MKKTPPPKPKITKSKLYIGSPCHGENVKVYRRGFGNAVSFKDPHAAIIIPIDTTAHAIHKVKIMAERPGFYGKAEIQMMLVEGDKVVAKSDRAQIKFDRMFAHSESHTYLLTIETHDTGPKSGTRFLKICKTPSSKALFYINRLEYKVIKKKKIFKQTEDFEPKFSVYSDDLSIVSSQNQEMLMTDTKVFPKISLVVYGDSKYINIMFAQIEALIYPNLEIIVGHTGDPDKLQNIKTEFKRIESRDEMELVKHCSGYCLFILKENTELDPFLFFNLLLSLRKYKMVYRRGNKTWAWMFVKKVDYNNINHFYFADCPEKESMRFDASFISCVNNIKQYTKYVLASLWNNAEGKSFEVIPILNFKNKYSAASALNIGINKAQSNIIIACHQDLIFYRDWINTLFERIDEVEKINKDWGLLGTAGITKKEDAIGRVYDLKGRCQWEGRKDLNIFETQSLDEHCVIFRKDSGLRFDEETFDGFHFYSIDLCFQAIYEGFKNYGITCPLAHISGSSSMLTGKEVYMKYLKAVREKWEGIFKKMIMPTATIERGQLSVHIKFKTPEDEDWEEEWK